MFEIRKKKKVKQIAYAWTLLCCPYCGLDLEKKENTHICPTHGEITDVKYLEKLSSLFLPRIKDTFNKFPNLYNTLEKLYKKT